MKKQIKKFVVLALAVGMLATSVLGTSAAFDPVYYAAQNPDVVKALGNSPAMLKLHYDMFGRKEARMSNKNDVEAQLRRLFNADDYAKLFPDVQKAFGNDKEAMFNHYIAFGLLEGRRPSEKVSQETASSLKKTVEKAMKDAGLTATPGSVEVVAAITGETSNVASAGGAAVQQTIAKVADVVAKEVTATVEEVQNPKPAASAPAPSREPEDPAMNVVWAHIVDASGNNYVSGNGSYPLVTIAEGSEYTNGEAEVDVSTGDVSAGDISANALLALANNTAREAGNFKIEKKNGVIQVTIKNVLVPKHRNERGTNAYHVGIGIPYITMSGNTVSNNQLYTVSGGDVVDENAAKAALVAAQETNGKNEGGYFEIKRSVKVNNKDYLSIYFGLEGSEGQAPTNKYAYLSVKEKSTNKIVAQYIIDCRQIICGPEIVKEKPTNGS